MFLSQFEYTIRHKKGKLHTNADYLSRPEMFVEVPEDEALINYKIDPVVFLMYYLEKGRFRKGASRKQIKRVLN
jgi:hypothetical protein